MKTPQFSQSPPDFSGFCCQPLIVMTRKVFQSSSPPMARFSGTKRHSHSLLRFPDTGRGGHSRIADRLRMDRALWPRDMPRPDPHPLGGSTSEKTGTFRFLGGRGLPRAGLANWVFFPLVGNANPSQKPAPVDGTDMINEREGAVTAHLS